MNILITGAWQGAKEQIKDIEKLGHRVVFLQQEEDNLPVDESPVITFTLSLKNSRSLGSPPCLNQSLIFEI